MASERGDVPPEASACCGPRKLRDSISLQVSLTMPGTHGRCSYVLAAGGQERISSGTFPLWQQLPALWSEVVQKVTGPTTLIILKVVERTYLSCESKTL